MNRVLQTRATIFQPPKSGFATPAAPTMKLAAEGGKIRLESQHETPNWPRPFP